MKNNAMKLLMVAWAGSIALLCGCDAGNREDEWVIVQNPLVQIKGGKITI